MKKEKIQSFTCFLVLCFSTFLFGETLLETANRYFNEDKLDKAEYLYKKALEQDANKAVIYFNLANIYYKKKDIAQSIEHYKMVIGLASQFKDAYLNIGKIHYLYGNYRESADMFIAYLAVNSNDQETQLLAGDVYLKMKLYDKAEQHYQAALSISSTNAEAYIAISDLYQSLGDMNRAYDIVNEGLMQNRDSVYLRETEAQVLADLGKYRESAAVYRSVIRSLSNMQAERITPLYYDTADVLLRGGYTNLAIHTVREYIDRFPGNDAMTDYLSSLYFTALRYDDAFEFYSSMYGKNRIRAYKGIKKLLVYAYNNDDDDLMERIREFYREHNIQDSMSEVLYEE
ncbi:tetratricopeptide repeat protein [Spirochaetota bacterium]